MKIFAVVAAPSSAFFPSQMRSHARKLKSVRLPFHRVKGYDPKQARQDFAAKQKADIVAKKSSAESPCGGG